MGLSTHEKWEGFLPIAIAPAARKGNFTLRAGVGAKFMKTYKVTLTVESEHTYEIEANTIEEAESVAEDYYRDGEDGSVVEIAIDVTDSYPTEE